MTVGPVMRPYRGPGDLRVMQSLVQETWSERSRFHIGDLAWNLRSASSNELDWPIALWDLDGRVIAFGWMQSADELATVVHPNHTVVVDMVLNWFEQVANSSELRVIVLESETHLVDSLVGRGYRALNAGPFDLFTSRKLQNLPSIRLPPGFKARPFRGKAELQARAEVHRAAWSAMLIENSPASRMSVEAHARVMATWPYDPELDWVIEAADGRLASCCIAWLDEKNRVGELEPVGTHPEFRRLGLAHAVCISALRALRQKGAESAVVYPRGDDGYPVPREVYGQLGFHPFGRTRTYARSS
jgi:GNAT superfamily N-acetyltransferase